MFIFEVLTVLNSTLTVWHFCLFVSWYNVGTEAASSSATLVTIHIQHGVTPHRYHS